MDFDYHLTFNFCGREANLFCQYASCPDPFSSHDGMFDTNQTFKNRTIDIDGLRAKLLLNANCQTAAFMSLAKKVIVLNGYGPLENISPSEFAELVQSCQPFSCDDLMVVVVNRFADSNWKEHIEDHAIATVNRLVKKSIQVKNFKCIVSEPFYDGKSDETLKEIVRWFTNCDDELAKKIKKLYKDKKSQKAENVFEMTDKDGNTYEIRLKKSATGSTRTCIIQ